MKKILPLIVLTYLAFGTHQSAHSAILLNSVDWATGGHPAYGTFEGSNNITFSTPTILNAGTLFNFDWGSMPFASSYTTSTTSSVAIGYTTGTSTTSVTFSQSISNLSLWFNFIDPGTTFNFGALNWTFVAGQNASRVGNTVVSTGTNSQNDGFLINVAGAFGASTPLSFTINKTGGGDTAGFTLSAPAPTNPVPEPGQVAASILLLSGIGGYALLTRRKSIKESTPLLP